MVARVDDPFLEQHVVLDGELGTLVGNLWLMDKFEVRLAKGEERFQTLIIPDHYLQGVDISQSFDPQFLSMFTHQPISGRLFVDAILSGQNIEPNFYEGWKAQQAIDAAIASHVRGGWVDL